MSSVTAEAHANIALVKYWGKHSVKDNIPATPSLSITLDALTTRTRIEVDASLKGDTITLNGEQLDAPKVNDCVARFRALSENPFPFVKITSQNNFPTAAGLASSASGYAALVTALNELGSLNLSAKQLSIQARIASGSAARSIHGGFSYLNTDTNNTSESWYATQLLGEQDWPMQVVIAICTEQKKSTSSSKGMQLSRDTSPYYGSWVESTKEDFKLCMQAVLNRDFEGLASISEHSCLKMHGLMLSTSPGLVYWNAATIECIHVLRALRDSGIAVFFTIDAGPQVKAVCLPEAVESVNQALSVVGGVHRTLVTDLGRSARIVDSNSDQAI